MACLRPPARGLMALALLAAQAPLPAFAEPDRIAFSYENRSDLRGILNLFAAFEIACLRQPVADDLGEALLPEGYRIVSSSMHFWGSEEGAIEGVEILSKTGSEEADWAGGHPFVTLRQPDGDNADGGCEAHWKRAWDYDDGVERVMLATAAQFDAWVSYYLEAILETKPDDGFGPSTRYGTVSEWRSPCWDRKMCRFELMYLMTATSGIEMRLKRIGTAQSQ